MCLEKLHKPHNDLSYLLERVKIEKAEKHVANLHEITELEADIKSRIRFLKSSYSD